MNFAADATMDVDPGTDSAVLIMSTLLSRLAAGMYDVIISCGGLTLWDLELKLDSNGMGYTF
jgi:hypothetical protein